MSESETKGCRTENCSGKSRRPHPSDKGSIPWPPLFSGTLVKRYKRFLADILLDTGEAVTAHCPNSGSMKSCSLAGQKVYLSFHDTPTRKLKYTWELIQMPESLVGVNTNIPNRLVKCAIEHGKILPFAGYDTVRAEVKTSTHSRLDLLLLKSMSMMWISPSGESPSEGQFPFPFNSDIFIDKFLPHCGINALFKE